jgi:hypothetical protein
VGRGFPVSLLAVAKLSQSLVLNGMLMGLGLWLFGLVSNPVESISCKIQLSHSGGFLDVNLAVDELPNESGPRSYESSKPRQVARRGLLPVQINGFVWMGFVGVEILEVQDPNSKEMSGAVTLVPHTNYPGAIVIPFSLRPGETQQIEEALPAKLSEQFLRSYTQVAEQIGSHLQAKKLDIRFQAPFANVDPEDFEAISRPLLAEDLEAEDSGLNADVLVARYIEEVDRHTAIQKFFHGRETAYALWLKEISADAVRFFYVIDLQGRENFYLLIFNTTIRYVFQSRMIKSNPQTGPSGS